MNHHFTTKKDHFQMVKASEKDTEAILALLIDRAKWFQENGSMQWHGLLEGVDSHRTRDKIEEGKVFIYRDNDQIAGMVMLLPDPSEWDEMLWQDQPIVEDAIYLHRIAVNRSYANGGLGKKILKWACGSVHFEGKSRIRLDCVADNQFLNAYYKTAGFTYLGEKDGYSLFERFID